MRRNPNRLRDVQASMRSILKPKSSGPCVWPGQPVVVICQDIIVLTAAVKQIDICSYVKASRPVVTIGAIILSTYVPYPNWYCDVRFCRLRAETQNRNRSRHSDENINLIR